ncbi:MAG: ergothioneine biosynthesis protein EgtB [Pirellulaceae bacterium]
MRDPNDWQLSLESLRRRYRHVRSQTEGLCESLEPEDCVIQSMPDVSPTRWHLAHTTWFFETFVLKESDSHYQPFHESYEYLFNSYYNGVGQQFPRDQRGLLSRPTVSEVMQYRRFVDERIMELLDGPLEQIASLLPIVELGLHHEQQHQELIVTDIKHVLSRNPLLPTFREAKQGSPERRAKFGGEPRSLDWLEREGGVYEIGFRPGDDSNSMGFAFDNESPRHAALLHPYRLASRLVTCGEYLRFMEDQGYQRPELWLSLGWQMVCEQRWDAPLYWFRKDGSWWQFTLSGARLVDADEPVCHISYFEADAYARWCDARLPTEFEWEVVARDAVEPGEDVTCYNLLERGQFHPCPATPTAPLPCQIYGDVWQWTASPYSPYPGYRPPDGAIGEYNGKFMCNQFVLRGGSCATPADHIRPTYRNFFPPSARWQFTGMRLAR